MQQTTELVIALLMEKSKCWGSSIQGVLRAFSSDGDSRQRRLDTGMSIK
jgi:hypothetical protein